MRVCTAVIVIAVAVASPEARAAEWNDSTLAGHWPLAGDAKDASAAGNHGQVQGITWVADRRAGEAATVAQLDGRDDALVIPNSQALDTKTGDFTLALWVFTDSQSDEESGDLAAKFDTEHRTGWTLSLRSESGVASNQPHWRQLAFGIDQALPPVWTDEGRPGEAILVFALAVFDGSLYAGTCEPGEGQSGRVYRYAGSGNWLDCGAPDRANAVTAMAVHDGDLYVGTGKYRLGGSALPESKNPHIGGRVFRYLGGKDWEDCGRLEGAEAVGGLVGFKGRLYGSPLYPPAGFFRYAGGQRWESLPTPGKRVVSLAAHDGSLWAGSYDAGNAFRFDGGAWTDLGRLGENTQTYAFALYDRRLHVATWPSGKVYYRANDAWSDAGRLGDELEVMGMMVHNGKLYAGTLPDAEVYRQDGPDRWTHVGRLDATPLVRYRRVWTMARYRGRLFCTTLPSGRVHAMSAGPCVTWDHSLSTGWHHVAAVRTREHLELYVDGRRAARSAKLDAAAIDVSNERPLQIGTGTTGPFSGRLSDVRLYRRALLPDEIATLASSRGAQK